MKSLFVTMINLKNELLQKYGNNQIFLSEVMNSDTTLMISFKIGKVGQPVGVVELTDGVWELEDFDYELFEFLLNEQKTLKEIGVLN
jgi:hypothetical protein